MEKSTLRWWYSIWAPFYDAFLDKLFRFDRAYVVSFVRGKKILEVCVGTGLNLTYYSKQCMVTGIDFSDAMLSKARQKAKK